MYSISLAFVIFIAVASQMQFQSVRFLRLRAAGQSLVVLAGRSRVRTYWDSKAMRVSDFRSIRRALIDDPDVMSVAWVSQHLLKDNEMALRLENVGGTSGVESRVMCASPNFFDVGDQTFFRLDQEWARPSDGAFSALSIGAQMYTARGSQSTILPSAYRNTLNYPDLLPNIDVSPLAFRVTDLETLPLSTETTTLLKPLAYLDSAPALRFAAYYGRDQGLDTIVSPSSFLRISDKYGSIEQLPIRRILIKTRVAPTGKMYKRLNQLVQNVQLSANTVQGDAAALTVTVWSISEQDGNSAQTMAIIDFFFVSITLVGLVLCFFSLVASMVSNIHEQSQDIAIVRAMGLTRNDVMVVYVFEAFVLVVASAILGMGVGYAVAWTFSSQRSLFLQLPLAFTFPWPIVVTVIGSAIVCASMAAGIPSRRMVQLRITELLRKFGS